MKITNTILRRFVLTNSQPPFLERILSINFLLLFILISFQAITAQDYIFFKIEDSQGKPKAIVAGDNFDGRVYHQELNDRDNGKWQFKSMGGGFYEIIDVRHNAALGAGINYDGNTYEYQADNRGDFTQWKLVEKGDNKFQIIDKKHGKAICGGNNYDGRLYHQDPGLRSNCIWNLTIINPENIGNRKGPKEIVLKEEFLSIKYNINEKIKDNNSNATTISLSDKYENKTSRDQTHKVASETSLSETNSWETSEEVSDKVWFKIGTEFSYAAMGASAAVSLETGFDQTKTNRKSNSKSSSYSVKFNFEENPVVPSGSITTCNQLITRETATIPYQLTVIRTYGDGTTQQRTIPGVWKGAVFARSEVSCTENSGTSTNQTNSMTQTNSGNQATSAQKLSDDEISELLEKLKEALPTKLEDEEKCVAIIDKWEQREDLSGKTKSQILKLLFEDVKSVVSDKKIQDQIWSNLSKVD